MASDQVGRMVTERGVLFTLRVLIHFWLSIIPYSLSLSTFPICSTSSSG